MMPAAVNVAMQAWNATRTRLVIFYTSVYQFPSDIFTHFVFDISYCEAIVDPVAGI